MRKRTNLPHVYAAGDGEVGGGTELLRESVMKSCVSYSKEMLKKAKAEQKQLITIDLNGKPIQQNRMTFQFIASPKMVKEAVAMAIANVLEAYVEDKKCKSTTKE